MKSVYDQRDELLARLEQCLPYLYLLEIEGLDTAKPIRMMIEQAESAIARAKGDCV